MAQVQQVVTIKQLPMMFMEQAQVFLVAQLQIDTFTEYCILKSILQVLFLFIYGVCIIVCAVWPVPMFPWVGMKEEVEPLPLAFQYLILML